jgi:hypothetical protein
VIMNRETHATVRTVGIIGIVLLATLPVPARAQTAKIKDNLGKVIRKVGVHVNMIFREPIDSDVTKGRTYGLSIGLSPGRTNGWTYPVGLTMFSEDLHSPSGAQFGVMRARAIMAGIGYGWHFGRLSTGASVQTGYAFNRGRTEGDVPQVFDTPISTVSVEVGNSLLLRPQVKAEYFITPKFTARVSADYMLLRPDIVVTTPTETITDRWNASNVHANIGIGYYPFRK